MKAAREATTRWFQPWADLSSASKKTGETGPTNGIEDPLVDYFPDSVEMISLKRDLEEGDQGSSKCVRKKRMYPNWNVVHDLTQTINLKLGLKFTDPTAFKDALKLYAIQ